MFSKLIFSTIIFLTACSSHTTMNKNQLLVTNHGWYLNDKFINSITEVNTELNKLPKKHFELLACAETEYDIFVRTMDIVHKLRFTFLKLNSNYSSPHCK